MCVCVSGETYATRARGIPAGVHITAHLAAGSYMPLFFESAHPEAYAVALVENRSCVCVCDAGVRETYSIGL